LCHDYFLLFFNIILHFSIKKVRTPRSQGARAEHQYNRQTQADKLRQRAKVTPKAVETHRSPKGGWGWFRRGGEEEVGRTSCHNYNFLMQIKTRCADFSLL